MIKRENIKFKVLLECDIDSAIIFNRAISYGDESIRHKYYEESFLNQCLSDRVMEWSLPSESIKLMLEEFEKLDKNKPFVNYNSIYKNISLQELNLSVKMESRLQFAKVKSFYDLLHTDLDKVRNMTIRGKREVQGKIQDILLKYK